VNRSQKNTLCGSKDTTNNVGWAERRRTRSARRFRHRRVDTLISKPLVCISMGDPAGIGPEITVKALQQDSVYDIARPVVVGSSGILRHYIDLLSTGQHLRQVHAPFVQDSRPGVIDVVETGSVTPELITIGRISASAGRAAFSYIEAAIRLALQGCVHAVVTAPINKESLILGGSHFVDHTTMLENATGSSAVTMFLVDTLRVFFLTRHVSLQDSINLLSADLVAEGISTAVQNLRRLGLPEPKIAVAALNPHASDGGMFGTEEQHLISPGVQQARNCGFCAVGPVPADAVFSLALRGKYDAVLSLYHDQGHIAAKTYDFERTVSVTLGLPFLRTSVDHGTALDIAGQGNASAVSMIEAIKTAARYAHAYASGNAQLETGTS